MSDMTRQTIRLQDGDDNVLKYIGAAVVLQWHHLPAEVQQAIRQQAEFHRRPAARRRVARENYFAHRAQPPRRLTHSAPQSSMETSHA